MPLSICASSQVRECTPSFGFQWNLTSDRLPGLVDQAEGVDAEALHRPVRARDAAVGHVPHRVVLRLGVQRDEVPERVVRALRLRDLPVGVRLAGVDDVRELDRVLDEEDRDVVADQVEGALVGVELRGEAAGVADGVGRPARAEHGGEPDEDRRSRVPFFEEAGPGDRLGGAVRGEHAVRAGAAGVHHALRDALVVEVRDLLAEVVVLQQHRAARAGLERVVGVAQPRPLRGREVGALLPVRDRRRAGLRAGRRTGLRCPLLRLRRQRVVRRRRLLERRRRAARRTGDIRGEGVGDLCRGGLHGVLDRLGGLAGIH